MINLPLSVVVKSTPITWKAIGVETPTHYIYTYMVYSVDSVERKTLKKTPVKRTLKLWSEPMLTASSELPSTNRCRGNSLALRAVESCFEKINDNRQEFGNSQRHEPEGVNLPKQSFNSSRAVQLRRLRKERLRPPSPPRHGGSGLRAGNMPTAYAFARRSDERETGRYTAYPEGQSLQNTKKGDNMQRFIVQISSMTKKDENYLVIYDFDEDCWECMCPHFLHRNVECKHIKTAKMMMTDYVLSH